MIYTVYRTINLVNDKEYIGFHKIAGVSCLRCTESENGSIFTDGYLGSGKNMRAALVKYGPMNMKQELLLMTGDIDEALAYESELVNPDWVKRDSNYNISPGGGVTILFGEANGFFGKKHTPETIEKLQASRSKTLRDSPFSWCEIVDSSGNLYTNHAAVHEELGTRDKWDIYRLVSKGVLRYKSEYLQKKALEKHEARQIWKDTAPERQEAKRNLVSSRFKGVPKTKESNLKRGASIRAWINDNPEAHKERMEKINKNPDKVAKMVAKQVGTKCYHNPENITERSRFKPGTQPATWVLGWPRS